MKKILTLVMAVMLAFSLAGVSISQAANTSKTAAPAKTMKHKAAKKKAVKHKKAAKKKAVRHKKAAKKKVVKHKKAKKAAKKKEAAPAAK